MSIATLIKKVSMAAAGAAFVALGAGGSAQAIQIGIGSFGSGAVMESFEGLHGQPNVIRDGNGYLSPGVSGPFTFASGVTLTQPIPNPGCLSGRLVCVGDWSVGHAGFGLAGNGFIGSAANVPDGTAYLGLNTSASGGPIEFTFASDILRVGAFVSGTNPGYGSGNGMITLSAFDALNNLLETVSISAVNVSNWSSNFLGLQNTTGIRKVTFNGDYMVMDKLTFEAAPTQSVPEPASVLGLLAVGALGATSRMKRKQQQEG